MTETRILRARHGQGVRIRAAAATLARAIAREYRYRRTIAALMEMEDFRLVDLGIVRADIARRVRGG